MDVSKAQGNFELKSMKELEGDEDKYYFLPFI